jgi:hypothetical protein
VPTIGEAGPASTLGSGSRSNHRASRLATSMITIKIGTLAISVMTAKAENAAMYFKSGRRVYLRTRSTAAGPTRQRAYCVNNISCPFALLSWHGKHVSCWASSTGLLAMNRPKPQPPVAAYFFESLTMI